MDAATVRRHDDSDLSAVACIEETQSDLPWCATAGRPRGDRQSSRLPDIVNRGTWYFAGQDERVHPDNGRAREDSPVFILYAVVAGLVVWHMRRPQVQALEGAVFVGSLAIVWLGVALAH